MPYAINPPSSAFSWYPIQIRQPEFGGERQDLLPVVVGKRARHYEHRLSVSSRQIESPVELFRLAHVKESEFHAARRRRGLESFCRESRECVSGV